MIGFYKNLKEEKPKNKALRQAKLDFLRQAPKKYSHPYYWAGFVLNGSIQPIEEINAYDFSHYVLGILVLILFLLIALSIRKRRAKNHSQ